MRDLDLEVAELLPWFRQESGSSFVLISVSADDAATWVESLSDAIRRCYIADESLDQRVAATGVSKSEALAARLPDRGSVMAGDFGEILVFLYLATTEHPRPVIGPKKWRLKQDRTKPAPFSDVVQFVVPRWPQASEADCVLCCEVKTKSTPGNSTPIASAISDCERDRLGRLTKTLVWLRERALHEDLGTTTLAHLARFIDATDHPPAMKRFHAVAVVCASLLNDEVAVVPDLGTAECTVVVIAVPQLQPVYEALFDAVHASVSAP
jgi:hypothetical protein